MAIELNTEDTYNTNRIPSNNQSCESNQVQNHVPKVEIPYLTPEQYSAILAKIQKVQTVERATSPIDFSSTSNHSFKNKVHSHTCNLL